MPRFRVKIDDEDVPNSASDNDADAHKAFYNAIAAGRPGAVVTMIVDGVPHARCRVESPKATAAGATNIMARLSPGRRRADEGLDEFKARLEDIHRS